MLTARAVSALLTALALAACSAPDATAPSPATRAPAASVALTDDEGSTQLVNDLATWLEATADGDFGAVAAATGGPPALSNGHFDLVASTGVIVDERYSYTARGTDFPTAEGELEIHGAQLRPAIQFIIHARVECMSVLGNQAWISGRATHVLVDNQEAPGLVGTTTSIRVQDNGEGAKDPDDRATLIFFRQNSQAWCRLRPQAPMTPTANGNIQVHAR